MLTGNKSSFQKKKSLPAMVPRWIVFNMHWDVEADKDEVEGQHMIVKRCHFTAVSGDTNEKTCRKPLGTNVQL